MKLYHGTSAVHIEAITREGLLPRARTGNSNWGHTVESHPELVYLTECYAGHYAQSSIAEGSSDAWAIVEVASERLDARSLLPDEDFLATFMPKNDERHPSALAAECIHEHAHLWKRSLSDFGCIGHSGPIPTSAITRIAEFSPLNHEEIKQAARVAVFSSSSHAHRVAKHRALTRWLMGVPVSYTEYARAWYMEVYPSLDVPAEPTELIRQLIGIFGAITVNRMLGELSRQSVSIIPVTPH